MRWCVGDIGDWCVGEVIRVFVDKLVVGIDPQNRVPKLHQFERGGGPELAQADYGKLSHGISFLVQSVLIKALFRRGAAASMSTLTFYIKVAWILWLIGALNLIFRKTRDRKSGV